MKAVVVDPSRVVLRILAQQLQANGHEAICFQDAHDALRAIERDRTIEALITSFEPNGLSGMELCWFARLACDAYQPLYIIVTSSSSDRRKLIEALDGGADDYIAKPVFEEELIARLRVAERHLALQKDLIRLANTDGLTGKLNRRAFFEAGAKEVRRKARPLSAAIFDIDKFKLVNDRYGHDAGDVVIRHVAALGEVDGAILGRLGGEEFALLFPQTDLEAARALMEDFRARCASAPVRLPDGRQIEVTCSVGVSQFRDDDSIDSALKRADLALYAAKEGGRNRVVCEDRFELLAMPATSNIRAAR